MGSVEALGYGPERRSKPQMERDTKKKRRAEEGTAPRILADDHSLQGCWS